MPINVSCEKCSRKIRVGDNLAGKKIKCPQCQNVVVIPTESAPSPGEDEPTVNMNAADVKAELAKRAATVKGTSKPAAESAASEKFVIKTGKEKEPAAEKVEPKIVVQDKKATAAQKPAEKNEPKAKDVVLASKPATQPVVKTTAGKAAPGKPAAPSRPAAKAQPLESYYVKTEDEEHYGPVTKNELDSWVEEGRLNADCQLLLEGSDQWVWATDLYPDLEGTAGEDEAPADEGGFGDLGDLSEPAPEPTPRRRVMEEPEEEQDEEELPTMGRGRGKVSKKSVAVSKKKRREEADDEGDGADDQGVSCRKQITAGLLAIFLGGIGAHRFYLGYVLHGVLMFVTCGGCMVWQIIDIVRILTGKMTDADGKPLQQ